MIQQRAVWSAISVLLAIATARSAVWLQSVGFSPLVLFPLIIGVTLGAMIGFVAVQAGETRWKLVVVGAVFAAAVCAAAEHGFSYLDYRRGFEAKLQSDPKAQLAATLNPQKFEPASFSKFMTLEAPGNWPLWIIDALAMIGAAGTAAWFMFSTWAASRSGDRS